MVEGEEELHHTFQLPQPSPSSSSIRGASSGSNGTAHHHGMRPSISAVTLEVLASSGHPNMTCLYR